MAWPNVNLEPFCGVLIRIDGATWSATVIVAVLERLVAGEPLLAVSVTV